MRHSASLFCCFLSCTFLLTSLPSLSAQNGADLWPAVTKEDLALEENPADRGAAAMILERQVYSDDEKRVQTEFVRIKIFTEPGRSYADVEIPYVVKSSSVENIRGRTLQRDGSVVPFSGVIFDKVVAKYKKFAYDAKAFTLPAVRVGSIIEYSYDLHWKERLPDYVRNPFNYAVVGGFTIPTATWTIQQTLYTRHAVFLLRPVKKGLLDFAKVRLPDDDPRSQPDGTIRMEVRNVAAIQEEDRMPPRSTLTSRVQFFYKVGPTFNYWANISKAKADVNQKFIERTATLERAALQIAPMSDPPETRLRKLYAYVQKVRYLSYEGEKTKQENEREHLSDNKSAEDIFKHNYASANEINYLFTALTRAAGFDSSIVEVVDRRSALFEVQVPDASQLNALVVVVRLNGQYLYFDPATRFCPYGMIPWFEDDTTGVRWDKSPKLDGNTVTVKTSSTDMAVTERTAKLKLQPDGSLEGTLEIIFTGQEALDRRLSGYDEDDTGRRKLMEDEVKELAPAGAVIDIDEITGWQDSEQPLRVKCHLQAARFAAMTSKRMLFPLSVFQANSKHPFPQVYRTQPVYFAHGYRTSDAIEVSLPMGYKLEALPPESVDITQFADFYAKRTSEPGIVRLDRHTEMKGYYFPLKYYLPLRAYFQKLRQSDAQNVILIREDAERAQ